LVATLANLQKEFSDDDIKIVVLNNGSTDSTADFLDSIKEPWPQLTVVHSKENLGCARGRETAWNNTKSEFVLSLDDDIIISRNGLLEMLRLLEAENGGGLVSPLIVDSASRRVLNPVIGNPFRAKFFYEGCFLFRSKLVDVVGYLDPMLAVAGEGLDYSIRIRRSGFNILRSPGVLVEHVDRVRDSLQLQSRRKKWLWCFCYLYWKNYFLPLALLLSIKDFLAHFRSGTIAFGWRFGLSLFRPAISGARQGRYAKSTGSTTGSARA
jgi:GT2 family glycosyltransferase